MKAFIVPNYASGVGKCALFMPTVERVLQKENIEYSVFRTVDKETDIRTVRENINNCDVLICLGGDGTVNEVINAALAESSKTPIGYIPCGSTNDFATNYSLPTNPGKAMKRILEMNAKPIDVGCLNGRYFCYVAAAGAFSEVSYATKREKKRFFGKAAYLLEGARSVPKIKPISLHVETDGETFEGKYLICTFSNSSRIGGIFHFAKGMVDYSDGKMELALIEDPGNAPDLLLLLHDLVKGNFQNRCIHIVRTDRVRITSDSEIAWSLDGEYGGSYRETDLFALNRRFILLC